MSVGGSPGVNSMYFIPSLLSLELFVYQYPLFRREEAYVHVHGSSRICPANSTNHMKDV